MLKRPKNSKRKADTAGRDRKRPASALSFFRNPETFTILKSKVFPEIIKRHTNDRPVRVWVPRCATGEEAYSVAIAFQEFAEDCDRDIKIQIFATDSDIKALECARAGIYPTNIANDVGLERLRHFFSKSASGYRVNQLIRKSCIFARQRLLTDPPFSRMDLVVYRNSLTSMAQASQKKIIAALHYSLAVEGFLLLDSIVSPRSVTGLLELQDAKHNIYAKITTSPYQRASSTGKGALEGRASVSRKLSVAPEPRSTSKLSNTQLQRQLEATRDDLQAVMEQQATDTEELQTANEELMASNEEFENVNRQLESVRAELVAQNEVLEKTNHEAQQVANDLINLLASIQMPILMVDRNLRIRRFTPLAKLLLKMDAKDVGRPFTDLNLNFDLPDLSELIWDVMETLRPIEQEVQDHRGNWYRLQIRPYKSQQNRIEGAVIAMVDIDQIKRDREKLRALVELSFEPIIVWDFERGIVEWNKGSEKLYGFSRDEAVGHNIHDLLRTKHSLPRAEFISRLQVSSEWKGELRHTSKSGRELIVESRQQTAEIGGRRMVLETNHDITETKRTELNADFLNKLDLEIAQIRDADAIVHLATCKLGEYLGVARCHLGEIDGQLDLSIVHESWEGRLQGGPSMAGEYPLAGFITPEIRVALETGQAVVINDVTADPQVQRADQYAALGIRAALSVPVASQGKWEATLTVAHQQPRNWRLDEAQLMRDVAIRVWLAVKQSRSLALLRESEAQARRTLVEQMVAGVAECDASGRFTMVNQRYCDITSRTKAELSQMRISEITHPDDWPANAELYKRLFENGESFFIEKRYLRKDGSKTWVHTHVSPIRNAQGKIEESVSVVVDVTARKRAEEQLRAAYERAEAATRAKDEFLSVVSHELRTPLVSILGYTQLLHKTTDPALIRRVVEVVERNSNTQLQLIEDLLDTSRIISGKIKLEMRPVNLADVINAALDVVRPVAEAKEIQLQSVLDPAAAQITGDPDRLQQIVWNLLSNSIKFTPKGGLVEVNLGRSDPYVQVVVRDNGKGVAPEFLPYVFDRFRQSDMSSTRRAGGLGLGLALVKSLVELHGGKADVESEGEDRGATFTVRLPVRAVYTPPPAAGEPVQALPRGDSESLRGISVLVVDDEQDVRTLLTLTLESYGAQVQAACSGKEALEALACNGPFDVLICDIGMPDEDGCAVIQKVRALHAHKHRTIPAIALTAYSGPEVRVRALESGFQLHVVKPVKPHELVAMIQNVIKQARLITG